MHKDMYLNQDYVVRGIVENKNKCIAKSFAMYSDEYVPGIFRTLNNEEVDTIYQKEIVKIYGRYVHYQVCLGGQSSLFIQSWGMLMLEEIFIVSWNLEKRNKTQSLTLCGQQPELICEYNIGYPIILWQSCQ